MAVWFDPLARAVMVEHCQRVYPNEGCGILVGRQGEAGWVVFQSLPVPNRNAERPNDRFEIAPQDFLRAERQARLKGWDVIGFFHSHPDVPPYPSQTDAQFAWSNFLTVIVGVFGGQQVRVRSHLFDGQRFHELPTFTLLHGSPTEALSPLLREAERLDLMDEVEPFITLQTLQRLRELEPGRALLVRFNYEPALANLSRIVAGEQDLLLLQWNEEGAWELLLRSREVTKESQPLR